MEKTYKNHGAVELITFPRYEVLGWRSINEKPTIHFIDETMENLNITIQFQGNLNECQINGYSFSYAVYSRQGNLIFNELVKKENIGFEQTNSGRYTFPISLFSIKPDTELSIKVWYNIVNENGSVTPISDNPLNNKYGLFSHNDKHIVLLTSTEVPKLEFGIFKESFSDKLMTISKIIERKTRTISLDYTFSGAIMVSVDGVTLANNIDFVTDGKIITFEENLVASTVVTVSGFVENSSKSGLVAESYIVPKNNLIQGVDDVDYGIVYDQETELFGVMLSKGVSRHNEPILSLNGVSLAYGLDYFVSEKNNALILLNGLLLEHDLVTIFFVGEYESNEVYDGFLPISITLENPITNEDGIMILELSSTSDFKIVEQAEIQYIKGENNYSFDLNYPHKGTRYIRVINRKKYTTVMGEEISDNKLTEISNTYKFIFK